MLLDAATIAKIGHLKAAQARKAEIDDIIAALKADIITALGDEPQGTDRSGSVLCAYSAARSFSPTHAAQFLTPEQIEACTVAAFNPSAAKKLLTGEQLDACMLPGSSKRFTVSV